MNTNIDEDKRIALAPQQFRSVSTMPIIISKILYHSFGLIIMSLQNCFQSILAEFIILVDIFQIDIEYMAVKIVI